MDRKEKKLVRIKMLTMMNENPNWYREEEKVQQIQALANNLEFPPLGRPKVKEKRSWSTFTRMDFLYYISKGYTNNDFINMYDVTRYNLSEWRKNNGFFNKRSKDIRRENAEEIRNICQMKRKQAQKERTNAIVG